MDFELIKCMDAPSYLNRRDTFFADLRAQDQYMEYHLPGAHSCPYERMSEWESRLPRAKKIIFYCEHGNLSLMAAKRLARQGYQAAAVIGGVECFKIKNSIDSAK